MTTAGGGVRHDIGVALLAILAAGLVFTLEYLAWLMSGGPGAMTAHSWLVLALFALPLLLSLLALAISLLRRPRWARWTAAILILLVPQMFMLGVLNG